jgi:hypothetical protein
MPLVLAPNRCKDGECDRIGEPDGERSRLIAVTPADPAVAPPHQRFIATGTYGDGSAGPHRSATGFDCSGCERQHWYPDPESGKA